MITIVPTNLRRAIASPLALWKSRRVTQADAKPYPSQPEIPAVIEIDGASPGMGILHVIGKTAPKNVHVGMRVAAVWQPASKRTGSITDIAYWMPINRPSHRKVSAK
jgi:hypothetical protein